MKPLKILIPLIVVSVAIIYFIPCRSFVYETSALEESLGRANLSEGQSESFANAPSYLITAYSELDSCHFPSCLMANGLPAQKGYVACPRWLELGQRIEIETLGEFICGDRYNKNLSDR